MKTSLTLECPSADGQRSCDLGLLSRRPQATLHPWRGACGSTLRSPPSALGALALSLEIAKNGPIMRGEKTRINWARTSLSIEARRRRARAEKIRFPKMREHSRERGIPANQPSYFQIFAVSSRILTGRGASEIGGSGAGSRVGEAGPAMVREIFLVNCPDREFGDRRLVPKWESSGRRDGAGQTEVAILRSLHTSSSSKPK